MVSSRRTAILYFSEVDGVEHGRDRISLSQKTVSVETERKSLLGFSQGIAGDETMD